MYLNMPSNFMKALNIKRKHRTKNEYFHKHIAFTIIYLLQEQKIKYRNYSEQEITVKKFV
jgi:hypothetical protein